MINPMIAQFFKNPMAMLTQQYNIPKNMNNPDDILQYLLNSGQVTQAQVNQAMSMRNNPAIQMLMRGMKR